MGEFRMPSLGADMDKGTVTQWLVKPGDTVHRGDIVAVVDTDKADVEVEVFEDGIVEELLVPEGTEVEVGTPLARIGASGATPPEPKLRETVAPATTAPPATMEPPAQNEVSVEEPGPTRWHAPRPDRHVSPLVRRLATELGVDLATVPGTGKSGGITRADVERVAGRTPSVPVSSAAPTAPTTRRVSPRARRLARDAGLDAASVPGTGPGGAVIGDDIEGAAASVTPTQPAAPAPGPAPRAASGRDGGKSAGMRAAIARAMARSKREIPHYYLANDLDFSRARAFLQERNEARPVTERVLPVALMIRATALAVRQTPELNGFWIDGAFEAADAVHVGIAISMRGGGLVAPAIHDVDTRDLDDLMAALRDLVNRTRAGSLRASEMSDPTITVTNLGEQGVDAVYGVIYPPQVAIVGFGAVRQRPWAVDGMVGAHSIVTTTLAADHRASDGARGAHLLTAIDRLLQEPEQL